MDYKKESLIKLLKLVEEISKQPGYEWFRNELELIFVNKSTNINNSVIDDIYEYCIKLIIKDHAEKFYSDFKISGIKEKLVNDFIRMEKFRREDNFEDFCLAAYQQLESIVNILITDPNLVEYIQNNKDFSALLKYDSATNSFIRKSSMTISKLIFSQIDEAKIFGYLNQPFSNWFFTNKFKAVLFYYYFNKEIKTNTDQFNRIYKIGNFLYQGRNLNHRGAPQSQFQQDVIDDLLPNQHKYYFKFLGFLEDFITTVNKHI
ncbi:hypothetical protein [Sediminibacterium sp.]|uniref:hypothetical protein n=1 Tax=Sediminibacterium sp. TaxID=1917865 RepID=UPI003F71C837